VAECKTGIEETRLRPHTFQNYYYNLHKTKYTAQVRNITWLHAWSTIKMKWTGGIRGQCEYQ